MERSYGHSSTHAVPGHEIIGRVTRVGNAVKKFKAGDLVGVGCMVDSDRTCPNCKAGEEQYCLSFSNADVQRRG